MKARWGLVAAAALAALAGSVGGSGAASAQDHMKMTFNWVADEGYLPFIYADELGYYKDAGIEVEFEQGRGSTVTAQIIAAGEADIGFADAGAAIGVAAKGGPIKLIAIINQSNNYGIVTLKDTPMASAQDLVGRKIAVCPGCAQVPLLDAAIAANGIDPSSVEIVSAQESAFVGLLTERQVDAVAQDPATIMVPLAERDIETKILYFRDIGVPLISFGLIANDEKLAANPDLYKRFVEASLKGLVAAIGNPEEAVKVLKARYPDAATDSAILEAFKTYSMPTFCLPGAKSYGSPAPEAWDVSYKVMTESMSIPTDRPMTDYYSLDYLPASTPGCGS